MKEIETNNAWLVLWDFGDTLFRALGLLGHHILELWDFGDTLFKALGLWDTCDASHMSQKSQKSKKKNSFRWFKCFSTITSTLYQKQVSQKNRDMLWPVK